MVKQHLKRYAAPRSWPIERKRITFIARPLPGAHKLEHQIPVSVALREMIKAVDTKKEAKFVLHNKDCLVDGKHVYDEKVPVGLFDVISLPKLKQQYRISMTIKNKLCAVPVDAKEANTKISKIIGKTTLPKGKVQLNLNDGRNILVSDAKKYSVGDSLHLEVPSQKILAHLKLEKGALVFFDAGTKVGTQASVESIEDDIVIIKTDKGVLRTKKEYAVVIGKDKPLMTL